MTFVFGYGSPADWYHIEFAAEHPVPVDASPFVFGASGEVLHLVGWGCGGELVRLDAVPPDAGC
jgi:hypothetical protein